MSLYAGSQTQVQRLRNLESLKKSKQAVYLSIPMLVSFQLLCCLCGLIIYAYFRPCDPLTSPDSPIQAADQLLPYFITTTLSDLPGLPGLCICGIFSASLSTVSSTINSLASVTSEDFIKPIFPSLKVTVFHNKIIIVVVPTRRRNMSHSSCHNRFIERHHLISRFGPVNWPPRSCDLTPLDYFLWGYVKSLVYADNPQTLDHLEDNIRRVIADIRPQMLEKVIENWTSRLDYIRACRGSPMPEVIFKM
ncbi:sodium-coupled monocarboxylate transporter 1 [Trichonephila clavipes]|nr:sodium-coupled monocarboxylate transporter 1 [Trichonephila clavipes]